MNKVKVFVYGTLKKGYYNHRLLTNAKYLGEAILHDYGVFNMSVGFPGIKEQEGYYVIGEIYEVTERELENLDTLEGFYDYDYVDNMYNRIEVEVNTIEEKNITVYAYEWNRNKPLGEDFIDNGRWSKPTFKKYW